MRSRISIRGCVRPSVRPSVRLPVESHMSWISEKSDLRGELEQNGTRNMKLYHYRTHLMSDLRQTCSFLWHTWSLFSFERRWKWFDHYGIILCSLFKMQDSERKIGKEAGTEENVQYHYGRCRCHFRYHYFMYHSTLFLDTTTHLYKRSCPSVHRSVRP